MNSKTQHGQIIGATSHPTSSLSHDDECIIAPADIDPAVAIFVRAEDGDGNEWGDCHGHDEQCCNENAEEKTNGS